MYDLTAFQHDLLYIVAGLDEPHGLAIKEELERRWMESAGAISDAEDLSLGDIMEARDAVDDNAALRELLLGDN